MMASRPQKARNYQNCISEDFNLKNFLRGGGGMPQDPLVEAAFGGFLKNSVQPHGIFYK